MCNTLLTQAWKMDESYFPKKSITTKYVLICLADMAWENGYCYPSISYICKKTLIKRSAVCNALKELENLGFLIKKHVFDKETGKQTSSDYWVNLPEIVLPATDTVHDMDGGSPRYGRGRVHDMDTNHNIEPLEETNNAFFENDSLNKKSELESLGEYRLAEIKKIYPNANGKERAVRALKKMGKEEFNMVLQKTAVFLEALNICKNNGFSRNAPDLGTFLHNKRYKEADKFLEDIKKQYESNRKSSIYDL